MNRSNTLEIASGAEHETPAALGRRMPAEWESHAGTWFSWPHNLDTWPDELASVEKTMAHAVQALSRHETVHINVNDAAHEQHVRTVLDDSGVRGAVRFHHIPTNDAWIRDHGGIFVTRDSDAGLPRAAVTGWRFNSWGGKYPPWDLDNQVPARMAEALQLPFIDGDMILEGGSIDVNGAGLLLTTDSCLLNENRNAHLSRDDIERRLKSYLGVEKVLWLGEGIAGDDTDGHIDDITRFVGPNTVVTVVETDREDENYEPLQENLELLRTFTDVSGEPLCIVTLPMPSPVVSKGERMPASYANFYVGNGVLLLPTYRDANDDKAKRTLERLFPAREVIPLDCTEVIWGLGAIHCLTQQIPTGIV